MQYGMNNNAGSDATTLTSTAGPETLAVENTAAGQPAIVGRGTNQGHGVVGESNGCAFPEGCFNGAGVLGTNTGTGQGVRGVAASDSGVTGWSGGAAPGVFGDRFSGDGVDGFSRTRNGVQGVSQSRIASGVYGENMSGGGFGIAGRSNVPAGAFGASVFGDNTAGGLAGLFNGTVRVNGTLFIPGGKAFSLDYPGDEQNRVLNHIAVESSDMMNLYNGNIDTDSDGNATVELPPYFEALNRDFRYQLTVIGQFAQAFVAEEVVNNRFSIKTDKPGVRVSWQVTGIRQDAYANAHRIQVEVEKPEGERGKYLTPKEHGQPASAGVYYVEVTPAEEPRMSAELSAEPRLRAE